jgi:hypothetical protein
LAEALIRQFQIDAGLASRAAEQQAPEAPAGFPAHAERRSQSRIPSNLEFHQTGRHAMAQPRLTDTTANTIRDRYQTLFAKTFTPNIRYEQMPGADERSAYALEYAAYRLGQIDDKLERLIEIMQRGSAQSPQA